MQKTSSTTSMYGHDGTMHHVVCIHCCTDHNQHHETFSCNKDSLCVLSSACSALNFRHIESVLIVFHTLTIFCCCETQDGYIPVCAASQNGHTEVVDLLVHAGADIHLSSTKVHVSTHTVSSSVAAFVPVHISFLCNCTVAFSGFANGGCLRATHVDMRMRGDTARIATASVHLRVQTTPALLRSQLLHLIGVRAGECAGQRDEKNFRVCVAVFACCTR